MVEKVEMLKSILSEEYGITTSKELENAIRKMNKINIGVFTTCVKGAFDKEDRKGA